MIFSEVEAFFKSWGLYPNNEDTSPYNKEVIDQGINEPCFDRMLEQAEQKHSTAFMRFCSRIVDATDNAFYLPCECWAELEDAWNARLPHER